MQQILSFFFIFLSIIAIANIVSPLLQKAEGFTTPSPPISQNLKLLLLQKHSDILPDILPLKNH